MTMLGSRTIRRARLTRKGRKYRCHWCGEAIEPGESYNRWTWKDGREIHDVKAHPECVEAWNNLEFGEDEVGFSEFSRGCTCQSGDCRCGEEL